MNLTSKERDAALDLVEVEVRNISGEALNWAVAVAEGHSRGLAEPHYGNGWRVFVEVPAQVLKLSKRFHPVDNWEQCGPLQEKHILSPVFGGGDPAGWAVTSEIVANDHVFEIGTDLRTAICRAAVAISIGYNIMVPRVLL